MISHLSSHPSSWVSEQSDHCRALKEDERVKRDDSSQVQSSHPPPRVCCCRLMFFPELETSVDIVCHDIDSTLLQELSFTCVVLTTEPGDTRARPQGFALFVALIKPSLMREPVTWLFKRAIKSHPVKLPV